MEQINLIAIFMTGLIAGGLTCLAVQGGLLATTIAQRAENKLQTQTQRTGHALPIFAFLVAKLVAYTLLGALLGWFGSLFTLNLTTQIIMQTAVGIFMLGTALNLLEVHPIFRYFAIQPPAFLARLVRKQTKRSDLFAPAILGVFTVFIPCGTTQAMMALAIATSSPWLGALTMFAFVLGTSPIFFLLGYFATKLGGLFAQSFAKVAAAVLIFLAFYTFNSSLALSGSSVTFQNLWCQMTRCSETDNKVLALETSLSDEVTIRVKPSGYEPSSISLPAGKKVRLHVINDEAIGCQQAFTIPMYGIRQIIRPGQEVTVELETPKLSTTIPFMCSMGMYRGVINVL